MDVTLQEHGAKHVYRVPEGLRELCGDITREVLRAQPSNIYGFIADYVDALVVTRENAKVAIREVKKIASGSERIVEILNRTGLSLAQIAAAAPRLQNVLRAYVDSIDSTQECQEEKMDENSRNSIRDILEASGVPPKGAEQAAISIHSEYKSCEVHRRRRDNVKRLSSSRNNSLVVDAIVESVRHRIIEKVVQSSGRVDEIPREFGNDETEASMAAGKIEQAYKERLRESRLSSKIYDNGISENFGINDENEPPQDFNKDQ